MFRFKFAGEFMYFSCSSLMLADVRFAGDYESFNGLFWIVE